MKLDIVNWHNKIWSPHNWRPVTKEPSCADTILMNRMTLFNRTSLPMMGRTVHRKIHFPIKINLNSRFSLKLSTSIKFNKANTIIANFATNMPAKENSRLRKKSDFLAEITPQWYLQDYRTYHNQLSVWNPVMHMAKTTMLTQQQQTSNSQLCRARPNRLW